MALWCVGWLRNTVAAIAVMIGSGATEVGAQAPRTTVQAAAEETAAHIRQILEGNEAATPCSVEPLQRMAVELEILDRREVKYVLTQPEDFASDVKLLQRRYRDLRGAPSAQDGLRFPPRRLITELLAFNRAYRQHLELRLPFELHHSMELQAAIQETDQLYKIWDTARDARCEFYYVTVRRQALQKLRELIGEEAYYTGNLPPPVPFWHFQRID